MNLKFVTAQKKDDDFFITLNRPEKCNAYDHAMAQEVDFAFKTATTSKSSLIVLTANGNHFCSGADLGWMKAARTLSPVDNIEDMRAIKDMFETILHCPLPIAGFVQGAVRAGGMGLVSCCDFAFAQNNSNFALTERKWGLTPGMITPIIVRKIGKTQFEKLNQDGTLLNTKQAINMRLITDEYTSIQDTLDWLKTNTNSLLTQERLLFAKDLDHSNTLEELLILSAEARHRANF